MGNNEIASEQNSNDDSNKHLKQVINLFELQTNQKKKIEDAFLRALDANDDPMSLNLTTELILRKVENQNI